MSEDDRRSASQAALNRHGYGFQFAVIGLAQNLYKPGGGSPWRLPVAEFPVEVGGTPTRIDVLLQHFRRPLYLLGECKRANPKLADWLFVRDPFVTDHTFGKHVFAEGTEWIGENTEPICRLFDLFPTDRAYQVAVEVTNKQKGDPHDGGRGAIEAAATQVMRGLNGLVEFLRRCRSSPNNLASGVLVPVIFTTARLWVSDVNLASADLLTGKVDLPTCSLTSVDWVWYHYHQSPGLRHQLPTFEFDSGDPPLVNALYADYVRPIAVVTAAGIGAFLQMDHWQ